MPILLRPGARGSSGETPSLQAFRGGSQQTPARSVTKLAETAPGMDDTNAMYREHFRLRQPLFEDGIAQDAQVFMTTAQNQVAANLAVALTLRDSVAVLTGPAGVGKTTLASHTLRAMTTRLALGWVGNIPVTSHELLEMLLAEFGFSAYKNSRVERLQIWRQFLNEMRATDTCVCVLVENADGFQPEILAALESLTAADPNGCPGANIVLTARAPLTELYALPALAALKQRTRMQCKLAPLSRDELRDYLAHRVTAAGGEPRELMTAEAIDALYRYSGGIVRVANNLCVTAFTMAAAQQARRLEANLVAHVASDVFGIAAPSATAPSAAAAAAPFAPAAAPASQPTAPAPAAHGTMTPTPAPIVTPTQPPVAPAAMGSMTPAPRPAAPAPVMPVVAKPMPAATPRAPSASAEATPAVARPAAMPRATAAPAMQPSVAPAAPPRAPAVAAAATAPQPPSAKPATLPGLATVATKPTPSQRLRAAIAAKSQSTSAIAPTPKPQPAPPTAGSPVAAKPSVAPVAPAPVAPRCDPPKAGPMSAPATRSAAPPSPTEQRLSRPAASSSPASRDDSIPMLTLDLEQDEDPFDLDFDMSAAQIDEALRTEMSEVPVLMDSVEVSGADAAVDLSMRLALDEETQRKLVNLEALSHAKALEDISNSMAETLFGDAELDQLAATLALATGSLTDDDDEALGLPAKHRAGT